MRGLFLRKHECRLGLQNDKNYHSHCTYSPLLSLSPKMHLEYFPFISQHFEFLKTPFPVELFKVEAEKGG